MARSLDMAGKTTTKQLPAELHLRPHSKPHVRMRGDPECRTEFEARRRQRAPPPAHNKDHLYHRNTDWDDDDRQKLIATLSGFISPDRAKHQGTWRPGSIQSRHAAAERWQAEQASLAEFEQVSLLHISTAHAYSHDVGLCAADPCRATGADRATILICFSRPAARGNNGRSDGRAETGTRL